MSSNHERKPDMLFACRQQVLARLACAMSRTPIMVSQRGEHAYPISLNFDGLSDLRTHLSQWRWQPRWHDIPCTFPLGSKSTFPCILAACTLPFNFPCSWRIVAQFHGSSEHGQVAMVAARGGIYTSSIPIRVLTSAVLLHPSSLL